MSLPAAFFCRIDNQPVRMAGVLALLLGALPASAQAPEAALTSLPAGVPQVSLFLLGVQPRQALMLRLRRFDANAGYIPVDSIRLTTDGPLVLADHTVGADPVRPALYEVALDRYARTEVVLRPGELPHGAATVRQLAQKGVYWENSPENTAYQDTLAEVQVLDSAIARSTESLRSLPATANRARLASTRALERRHRALATACAREPLRYAPPNSFAATVLASLARYPVRPDSLAYGPGYLAWLGPALAADFPLATDEALRHYAGAARLGQHVWQVGPLLPGGPAGTASALLARRQGHDAVNTWLWTTLTRLVLARDEVDLLQPLELEYRGATACRPGLPPTLADQLAAATALAPGQPAPPLALPDTLGQPLALAAEWPRHCYTLVYGWVSWCHTCQAETPALQALLRRLGPHRLGVYAASLDETRPAWRTGLRQHGPHPLAGPIWPNWYPSLAAS